MKETNERERERREKSNGAKRATEPNERRKLWDSTVFDFFFKFMVVDLYNDS